TARCMDGRSTGPRRSATPTARRCGWISRGNGSIRRGTGSRSRAQERANRTTIRRQVDVIVDVIVDVAVAVNAHVGLTRFRGHLDAARMAAGELNGPQTEE